MRQEQISRNRYSVPRMNEIRAEYEQEEHERQMRHARKAVKRARALIREAESFLFQEV